MLRQAGTLLKPGGRLLVVEYAVDAGNMWVPYPCSFGKFQALVLAAGFSTARMLATHPSSFLRGFYSAEAIFNTTVTK